MAIEQKVVIRGEDQASAAFRKAQDSAKSFGTKVFELTTTMSSLINIGKAVTGVIAGFGKALQSPIQQAIEAEKAQTLLAAKLRATGQQAGYTAADLNELAARLSRVTTYSDDTITSTQGLLLSYTNITRSGGAFERALQLSLDLSSAMGIELKSATEKVAKALNDPVAKMGELAEVGVTFTKAEKEVIKAMVEANDVASAQGMILERLEGIYGGTATAVRNTFGGALQGLKNAWDDVLESIGKFLTENEKVKLIINAIVETVQSWADALSNLEGNLDAQTAAAEGLRSILTGTLLVVEGLVLGFGAMGKTMATIIEVSKSLGGVLGYAIDRATGGKLDDAMRKLGEGSDMAAGKLAELRMKLEGLDLQAPTVETHKLETETAAAAESSGALAQAMSAEAGQATLLTGALTALTKVKQLMNGVMKQIAPEYDATRRRIQALLGELKPVTGAFEVWVGLWDDLRESAGGNLGEQLVTLQGFEKELRATVELSRGWKATTDDQAASIAEVSDGMQDVSEQSSVVVQNAEEIAEAFRKAQEEWNRSVEAMSQTSSDSFRDIFVDAFAGMRSLQEGFYSFSQTVRQQMATALLDPILGAQGPLAQLFNPVFNALKQIGTSIATNFIQPLIQGFLSYIGVKVAGETFFAGAAASAHSAAAIEVAGTTAAALASMMPGLGAAATAALIATFGGAAAAAALLPGLIAVGATQGAAIGASLTAGAGAAAAMADGGRVTRPTLTWLGEAGQDEVVIPEERTARSRSLIADLFARRPELAPVNARGGGSVVNNNYVTIHGIPENPEAVAQQLYEAINKKLGRSFRVR